MTSFAVTAYNEMSAAQLHGQRLLDCIRPAQNHPAISEIVVVDDGSEDFEQLADLLRREPKVTFHHNPVNRGVFGNKIEAIARAAGPWVITCDSDNLMKADFIDKILAMPLEPHTWYCPSFARTHFDYRSLIGKYDLSTIGQILDRPMGACCLNTGNQIVCRETFMGVFGKYRGQRADLMMPNWLNIPESEREKRYWRLVFDACDSFILNMEWLTAGNRMHVVEGLEYDHYYGEGEESNYARAPKQKTVLNDKLMQELRQRSGTAQ